MYLAEIISVYPLLLYYVCYSSFEGRVMNRKNAYVGNKPKTMRIVSTPSDTYIENMGHLELFSQNYRAILCILPTHFILYTNPITLMKRLRLD